MGPGLGGLGLSEGFKETGVKTERLQDEKWG